MKLEDQVCTVSQGIKLYELIKMELNPCFFWVEKISDNFVLTSSDAYKILMRHGGERKKYPAYTVAELGILIRIGERLCNLKESIYKDQFHIDYHNRGKRYFEHFSNEAEMRADFLIWLIENDIINPAKLTLDPHRIEIVK